jgi:putative tryptophan/tyrosine transport system substrate-binding protein
MIGFLGGPSVSAAGQWVTAFKERLHELGWIEGRTVAIEVRWAEGRTERFAEIASEFVRLKVDVIVTAGPPVFAAKQATSVIPIVFATVADPLGSGLVASLSQPGGNVTGLSLISPELAGKRLELMREIVPSLRRLAIMANAAYPPAMRELNEVEPVSGDRSGSNQRRPVHRPLVCVGLHFWVFRLLGLMLPPCCARTVFGATRRVQIRRA